MMQPIEQRTDLFEAQLDADVFEGQQRRAWSQRENLSECDELPGGGFAGVGRRRRRCGCAVRAAAHHHAESRARESSASARGGRSRDRENPSPPETRCAESRPEVSAGLSAR
jgi:hypothetical protein